MIEMIKKIRRSVLSILTSPAHELGVWQRRFRWSVEFGRHCWRELMHDRAGQMAAALTYHTLFSLLPMLVLMLVVGRALLTEDQVTEFRNYVIEGLLPTGEQVLDPTTSQVNGDSEPDSVDEAVIDELESDKPVLTPEEQQQLNRSIAEAREEEFEQAREELNERFDSVLNRLEQVDFRSIGIIGLLIFIWGATALLATIEKSFNFIYGADHARSWYFRIPLYYTIITLGPLIILAGLFVRNQLFDFVQSGAWLAWLTGPLAILAPFITTWLVIFAIFILMPNTRVRRNPALIGSLVATIIWIISRELFTIYLTSTAMKGVYGALALLPMFLLWLWISWIVILFGLEISYTGQAMAGNRFKNLGKDEDNIIEDTWILPLSVEIARAFQQGKTASLDTLARQTKLTPRVILRLLQPLAEAGYIRRIDKEDNREYILARPAEGITIAEILEAAHQINPADRYEGMDQTIASFFDELRDREREITSKKSLADLIRKADTKSS